MCPLILGMGKLSTLAKPLKGLNCWSPPSILIQFDDDLEPMQEYNDPQTIVAIIFRLDVENSCPQLSLKTKVTETCSKLNESSFGCVSLLIHHDSVASISLGDIFHEHFTY